MPLPPHHHHLDWFVIPEIKGENPSFLTYTKTGWVCRICSTDKLASVEEHCQTNEHRRHHEEVEQRKIELAALVAEAEQRILEERKHQELKHIKKRHAVAVAMKEQEESRDSISKNITATERRATLKESRGYRMEEEVQRRRERAAEDLSGTISPDASLDRARQLRAERLLSGTTQHSTLQKTKEEKARRKELRRLAVLETTQRHQKIQQEEKEEPRKRAARKRKDEPVDSFPWFLPALLYESTFCAHLCGFAR